MNPLLQALLEDPETRRRKRRLGRGMSRFGTGIAGQARQARATTLGGSAAAGLPLGISSIGQALSAPSATRTSFRTVSGSGYR
jgi:hypothetical protein